MDDIAYRRAAWRVEARLAFFHECGTALAVVGAVEAGAAGACDHIGERSPPGA